MRNCILATLFPARGERTAASRPASPARQVDPPLTLTFSPRARGGTPARFGLVLVCLAFTSPPALAAGDPERGAQVYEGCQDCHSLDKNDVGPRHRGVFGRKAGSLSDFAYSPALKDAGFVWDEPTLDKWLTDPQAFRPGVRMFYHLADPQDRADVIAFLRDRAK